MPIFSYKATDKEKKLVTGDVTAGSVSEIEGILKERNLDLLSVKEKKQGIVLFRSGIPTEEKISLCRYLSLIINSGVPLAEGLDLLGVGMTNVTVRRVLEDVANATRRGQPLHVSFAKYRSYFGSTFLTMIKTGEMSGTLADSFMHLSKQYEQEKDLKGKIMSALLYPMIIVLLMLAVGVVLFTFVLPQLAEVFTKLNLNLPLHTRIMFGASLFMKAHTALVLGSIFGSIVGLIVFFRTRVGKQIVFKIALWVPVVKKLILECNLVRFSQNLSALLGSGVALTKAIELALQAVSFGSKDKLIAEFQEKITKGMELSRIFEEADIFPPLMIQLVRIGEKTGNLEKTLSDLSEFYQQEVEKSLKAFVTILEPALLIVVGIGVGVMVVSVISPIYSLIGQLQTGT